MKPIIAVVALLLAGCGTPVGTPPIAAGALGSSDCEHRCESAKDQLKQYGFPSSQCHAPALAAAETHQSCQAAFKSTFGLTYGYRRVPNDGHDLIIHLYPSPAP